MRDASATSSAIARVVCMYNKVENLLVKFDSFVYSDALLTVTGD
jgi:hypothetical protein